MVYAPFLLFYMYYGCVSCLFLSFLTKQISLQIIVMNFHVGALIQREMKRQERTPSWLSKKIFCDRTNIHKIYKKKSIDSELLYNISKALNHNFFEDLSQLYQTEDPTDTTEE